MNTESNARSAQQRHAEGAILQPMYIPMISPDDDNPRLRRPIELKVQILFGETVGACLNTHPQFLYVFRSGEVYLWEQSSQGLLRRHHGHSEPLPEAALETLCAALREHWVQMRRDSEHLARCAGLDEIRVDWLLGDPRWGPRIGELTYMGTFALDVLPVSLRLARAFATGHLSRLRAPPPSTAPLASESREAPLV